MTGRKGCGLAGLLILGLLALPSIPLRADTLGDAYKAFEKGQFEEAAKSFQSHAQKKPEDYDQLYNTGVALFQKGAHEEAISYFDRAMKSPDPQLKSRSAYNKGVAYGQQQRWDEAEAAFQDALSYDNENTMIQENLQFAREQKNRQKKQEPQQNQANQNPNQQTNEHEKDEKTDQKQAENQTGKPQNAENQAGKPQNTEKQTADSTGKPDDPLKKSEQGQTQEQQTAQQKGQAVQPQDKGETLQKDKDGNLAEKKEGQEAQKDPKGNSVQPGDAQALREKDGQRVLTIKDLKKQEAEKLLRSVDDRIGSYILTPEQANTEGKSSNGKDW